MSKNIFYIFSFIFLFATSLQGDDECCSCRDYYWATDCNCSFDLNDTTCCRTCCCNRPSCIHPESRQAFDCGSCYLWLPQDPPLFRPFAADPRQLTYSMGHRYNDEAITKDVIPVSFWDTMPIVRYFNYKPLGGMLQWDIDGALWAVFDPATYSAPLINADYYVGFPLTYAWRNWSFRLRFYHISCHLGDEFLLNNPNFDRRNPSVETVDFFVSNDITEELRVYYGLGWVINRDPSYKTTRFLTEGGVELRIPRWGFCCDVQNLVGRPIFAMHFRYKEEFHNHVDQTYILGYEFAKTSGQRYRWRMVVEYHDGYSLEGQFSRDPTNYFAYRLSYGY